jgi:hypothetical protein
MNNPNREYLEPVGDVLVTLDCEAISLPAGRNTLASVRSYLETMALANQRVLAEISVDGFSVDLAQPLDQISFRRLDALTVPLSELPLLLLTTARHQVDRVKATVEATLTLVLINPPTTARELWWKLACQLKEPVLTLSLMPEQLCQIWCGTTFQKLRRWQLEQIAIIVERVDATCAAPDTIGLSDALETMVLPWLENLGDHIRLWQDAMQAGARLGIKNS